MPGVRSEFGWRLRYPHESSKPQHRTLHRRGAASVAWMAQAATRSARVRYACAPRRRKCPATVPVMLLRPTAAHVADKVKANQGIKQTTSSTIQPCLGMLGHAGTVTLDEPLQVLLAISASKAPFRSVCPWHQQCPGAVHALPSQTCGSQLRSLRSPPILDNPSPAHCCTSGPALHIMQVSRRFGPSRSGTRR